MTKYSIFLAIAITILSCKKPIEYQFVDSPETINCKGIDYDLAHEVYYSFRQDLAIYVKNLRIGYNYLNYQESLGYYIYRGALGNFDFNEIRVKQTPSQAIDKPISFFFNLKLLFTKILIPLGLFDIFDILP